MLSALGLGMGITAAVSVGARDALIEFAAAASSGAAIDVLYRKEEEDKFSWSHNQAGLGAPEQLAYDIFQSKSTYILALKSDDPPNSFALNLFARGHSC